MATSRTPPTTLGARFIIMNGGAPGVARGFLKGVTQYKVIHNSTQVATRVMVRTGFRARDGRTYPDLVHYFVSDTYDVPRTVLIDHMARSGHGVITFEPPPTGVDVDLAHARISGGQFARQLTIDQETPEQVASTLLTLHGPTSRLGEHATNPFILIAEGALEHNAPGCEEWATDFMVRLIDNFLSRRRLAV